MVTDDKSQAHALGTFSSQLTNFLNLCKSPDLNNIFWNIFAPWNVVPRTKRLIWYISYISFSVCQHVANNSCQQVG